MGDTGSISKGAVRKQKIAKDIIFLIILMVIAAIINIAAWDTMKSIPLFKSSKLGIIILWT